jgi:WD40 repeat protein
VLPDGRLVAVTASDDETVRVWDLTTGTAFGESLPGHTGPVVAVATGILPDGRLVAVTASWDETVRVWDLTTGTALGEPLTGHTNSMEAVATGVLPDGRLVAVTGGYDATVRMWDLTTRRRIGTPLNVNGPIAAVALAQTQSAPQIVVGGDGIALVELRTA